MSEKDQAIIVKEPEKDQAIIVKEPEKMPLATDSDLSEKDQAIIVKEPEYVIEVRDVDSAGKITDLKVPLATNSDFDKWSLLLRAAVLKKGTWAKHSMIEIVHAILYAERNGLDIVRGEVYSTGQGRIAANADAVIRHAMSSGRIEGYRVELTGEGEKLEARVSVSVKGFTGPVESLYTFKEWFIPTNPNWRDRPRYMLRKRALAKALGEIVPLGFDPDEVPPVEASTEIVSTVKAGTK